MYKPTSSKELRLIVNDGDIPLDDVDVSDITDFSFLFSHVKKINGCIENWDMRNAVTIENAFIMSEFECNLSKWNVPNLRNIRFAFYKSKIEFDITYWKIKRLECADWAFAYSNIYGSVDHWNIDYLLKTGNCGRKISDIFFESKIKFPDKWKIKSLLYNKLL